MTDPNELVAFVLARIDDVESLAVDMRHQIMSGRPLLDMRGGGTLLRDLIDPDRIQAECEAKRQIVYMTLHGCGDDYERIQRALAALYADHPDYRAKWKP